MEQIPETASSQPRTLFLIALSASLLLSFARFPFLQTLFGIAYIAIMSQGLGKRFFPYANIPLSYGGGLTVLASYYVLGGSVLFYLATLSHTALIILTVVSPVLLIGKYLPAFTPYFVVRRIFSQRIVILFFTTTLTLLFIVVLLVRSRALGSVVSPWITTPKLTFILFFSAIVAVHIFALKAKHSNWFLYVPTFFVFFAVLLFVFPMGFGFDPFIHEATEKLIYAAGTITPKPLYYSGYYSLIVWAHSILGVPLRVANAAITQVFAAMLIPLLIAASMRYLTLSKSYAAAAPLVFLLLPLADLTQSTPFSLALVWALVTIQLSIVHLSTTMPRWYVVAALALAALALHPLVGIPLCMYIVFVKIYSSHEITRWYRTVLLAASAIIGALGTPFALLVASHAAPDLAVALRLRGLTNLMHSAPFYRFIRFDDLTYSMAHLIPLLILLFICIGYSKARRERLRWHVPSAVFSASLIVSYILTSSFLVFNFAAPSEAGIFADRFLTIFFLVSFPLAAYGFTYVMSLAAQRVGTLLAFVVIAAALVTVSWYMLYPRFDTRSQNKGYSPSMYDYAAVHWIHDDAGGTQYVVLANQTVSAVAVREFGFLQYHHGLLYYPLPTNGMLYPNYLALTNTPQSTPQILERVRSLTGTKRVYVVINRYWSNAVQINDFLSQQTPVNYSSGDGEVTVYRFDTP